MNLTIVFVGVAYSYLLMFQCYFQIQQIMIHFWAVITAKFSRKHNLNSTCSDNLFCTPKDLVFVFYFWQNFFLLLTQRCL